VCCLVEVSEVEGSNPTGAWMSVCCEVLCVVWWRSLRLKVLIPLGHGCLSVVKCCVLSGGGLCDEVITRPEESYRLWCVVVCDLENS